MIDDEYTERIGILFSVYYFSYKKLPEPDLQKPDPTRTRPDLILKSHNIDSGSGRARSPLIFVTEFRRRKVNLLHS